MKIQKEKLRIGAVIVKLFKMGGIIMNQMKKVAVAMFAVLCMVCMPFIQAKAEEEMILIYAQVPSDWENPCVWAWADDGTNAFEAWPGGAMKADDGNQGWYYAHIKKSAGSNVIINANEGSVQTKDYKTNDKDAWITVTDADTVVVSNEQQTEGELPAYEAMISIYAQVPEDWLMPSLWAWSAPDGTNVFANWPGQELTEGTDGWYTYDVPAWVNSVIINGNAGEVQTTDITVEAKDVWIIVEDAENYEISYEQPVAEVAAEDLIQVHAQVPSDWLLPSLWAWSVPDGTNVFANWPGQELTEGADGWYTYNIPNWVNSIIVNGNLGEVQTTDITIEPKDLWVVVKSAEEYELYYEEPAIADTMEENISKEKVISTEDVTSTETEEALPAEETNTGNTGLVIGIVIAALAVAGIGVIVYKKRK